MAADGSAAPLLPSVMRGEIAVPYGPRDLYRQFLTADGRLWNEDMVLQLEAGGDLRQYRDLLRDAHVKATLEQRFTAVTSSNWSVQPGLRPGEEKPSAIAQEAADFVTANLERVGWDNVTRLMLFATFYGYSIAELLWDVIPWKGSAKFQWKAIKVRDRARFLFTPDGRAYLNTGAADPVGPNRIWCPGTLDEPYFWQIATGDENSDNPYGLGLAHQLYWLVRFKRDCIRWWMIYNEKFAQPTVVGKFPAGATAEDKQALLGAVLGVLTQSGIIVPITMEIDLLESAKRGSSDYGAFIAFVNGEISKCVMGQTLTTEVGDSGSRALGDVHEGVGGRLQKSDGDLVNESANVGPIAWLVIRNFGADCPLPTIKRETEEKTNLTELSKQLGELDAMGFRPTLDLIEDNWGAGFEDLGPPAATTIDPATGLPKDVQTAPGAAGAKKPPAGKSKAKKAANDAKFAIAFAAAIPTLFPDQASIDGALTLLEQRMRSLPADLLMPLVDFATDGNPASVMATLQHGLPQWKDGELVDAVAQVMFVGKTMGRAYGARD